MKIDNFKKYGMDYNVKMNERNAVLLEVTKDDKVLGYEVHDVSDGKLASSSQFGRKGWFFINGYNALSKFYEVRK